MVTGYGVEYVVLRILMLVYGMRFEVCGIVKQTKRI